MAAVGAQKDIGSAAGGAAAPLVSGMDSFVARGARPRIMVTTHAGHPVVISAVADDDGRHGVALPVVKDDPPAGAYPALEFEDAEARIAALALAAEGDEAALSLDGCAYVLGVEKDGQQKLYGLVERDGAEPKRLIEAYLPPIEVGYKTSYFPASEKKSEVVIPTTKKVVAAIPEQEWFPPILKDGDKKIATYVVLEPDEVDKQGDIYGSDVIEAAAHDFLANYNKNKTRPEDYEGTQTGERHVVLGIDADVVESYVAPCDLTFGEETVKKGSWVASLQYRDEDIWEKVKTGELPGISIGGAARAILLGAHQEKS